MSQKFVSLSKTLFVIQDTDDEYAVIDLNPAKRVKLQHPIKEEAANVEEEAEEEVEEELEEEVEEESEYSNDSDSDETDSDSD